MDDDCLLEDFLLFVTEREKRLLKKAIEVFSSLTSNDLDRLNSFFTLCRYLDVPRKDSIQEQILPIADQELVKKPAPLCTLIRRGIPQQHMEEFWHQPSIGHITHMVMQQRPSTEKVTASLVATEDPLNDIQETALYYLKEYVGSLHQELLADFLLFCTVSVLQPSKMKVSFTSLCGLQRRPIAHTCSNHIELTTTYTSFQEFRR